MKVILTNEVSGLGTAGDVVDVKDGYARNYLLPRHLATPWTKGGQKFFARQVKGTKGKFYFKKAREEAMPIFTDYMRDAVAAITRDLAA